MPIYEITPTVIRKISETSFAAAGIKERGDLQRLLRDQIEVISPETLVVAEEFGEWEDSRRRIDLLGLDRDANLVVVELKRTEDGGHMELQAVRYAAMVSTLTFDKVAPAAGLRPAALSSLDVAHGWTTFPQGDLKAFFEPTDESMVGRAGWTALPPVHGRPGITTGADLRAWKQRVKSDFCSRSRPLRPFPGPASASPRRCPRASRRGRPSP